jgi:NADPH:quinone reductase-like Zn-dependent oxidoreductase
MRAARRVRYGLPDVIRVDDIPTPTPGPGEVLVRVHATTVSRTDCALLEAKPFFMRVLTGLRVPRLATLGTDFAGTVDAIGPGVTRLQTGDRVWGIEDLGAGSQAEWMLIREDKALGPMPEDIAFTDAVACIEGAWYAHSVVERVGGVMNARVLIYGAAGAIGSALLQLCVHGGADVTAVGDAKHLDLLRSLGAARVIDRGQQDFTHDDQVYDFVFDAVGKSTFGRCRRLLGPRGVYVSTDLGPGGQNLLLPLLGLALRGQRVVFPVPVARGAFLAFMRTLVAAKQFRPVIDRTYPLEQVRDAYAYVRSGQKTGCVVLKTAP